MSVVACFGCSWTHGATFDVGTNWVNELAKLYPQHQFFNLSLSSSSVLHSIWVMEQAKKHIKPNVTVFQLSNEGRMTYYLDHEINEPAVLFNGKNLRWNDPLPNVNTLCLKPETVQSINYGTLSRETATDTDTGFPQRRKFAEMYYTLLDTRKTFYLEQQVYAYYIKNNVDLAFYHTFNSIPPGTNNDLTCIETVLGHEQFNNYSSDGQGYHFTEEGCQWQANYIKSLIEHKL